MKNQLYTPQLIKNDALLRFQLNVTDLVCIFIAITKGHFSLSVTLHSEQPTSHLHGDQTLQTTSSDMFLHDGECMAYFHFFFSPENDARVLSTATLSSELSFVCFTHSLFCHSLPHRSSETQDTASETGYIFSPVEGRCNKAAIPPKSGA